MIHLKKIFEYYPPSTREIEKKPNESLIKWLTLLSNGYYQDPIEHIETLAFNIEEIVDDSMRGGTQKDMLMKVRIEYPSGNESQMALFALGFLLSKKVD